ncbi:polysaccharide deacetylase family protein, partial [Streptomyces meridianus]
ARALAEASRQLVRAEAARAATARSWGLGSAPLRPPPPPAPEAADRSPGEPGPPPVLGRVHTTDRVIFLTIDDGSRKDPELLRMMNDLQVPFSAFLTDDEVGDGGYDYFRELRRLGVAVHNHALFHRYLPGLPYAEQVRQICGQQQSLLREMGEAPRFFRPPYGAYNRDTLRAATACGIGAVPLWTAEAFPDRIEYSEPGGRLRPGDIVLTHFRGPAEWDGDMPDVVRRVLEAATAQGLAVARLEDYL